MSYRDRQNTYIVNQPVNENPFLRLNNEWTVGLFECCDDVSQCCFAYWCFSCFLCSLADRINESKASCCCVPNVLAIYRMKVRSLLGIDGDACSDYCITSCCPFCAALQMMNELANNGID